MSNPFENMSDDAKSVHLLDYVKGRLNEDENAAVEAAISADKQIADEVAYYQGLANAAEPALKSNDHEFAWSRLSKAIDDETVGRSVKPAAANDNSNLWRVATFALGVLLLGQTGVLLNTGSNPSETEPVYVTVSEEALFDVQVIFAAGARLQDIEGLLRSLDGEIVGGPSALGLYDIRFETEEAQAAGLKAFRGDSTLIEEAMIK